MLPTIPLTIRNQIIQPKRQESKLVALQILRVSSAKVDSCSDARDASNLVGVDESPSGGETGVVASVEGPEPRDDEEVVCEGVAELVPPVFADNF